MRIGKSIEDFLKEEVNLMKENLKKELLAVFEKTQQTKELLTRKELANYLSVSLSTVDNNAHKLGKIKIGRYTRFKKSVVDQYYFI